MTAIMCGITSTKLNEEEIELLRHPLVCGVILFKRNYQDYFQLKRLVDDIKSHFGSDFLIAVDQEGGRVKRFSEPFSQLPALAETGKVFSSNPDLAKSFAHIHAWLMSSELLSIDIDLSFAPVLDIDNGSNVIGDRAFSQKPEEATELAEFYCRAMHDAGMKTTAKHFPGHGTVVADSHFELPIDNRSLNEIENFDLIPFASLIQNNLIDAVMMSHVIYSEVCDDAAGYSKYWCQDVLRKNLGFKGVIISDDLGMKAADCVGDVHARYQACVDSGVDMALACTYELSAELLEKLPKNVPNRRFPQLKGHSKLSKTKPFWQNRHWQTIRNSMELIEKEIRKQ